jgi:uncharacterized protein
VVVMVAALSRLRTSQRWRGSICVLVGMPALAIAVGFGPHVVKGGPMLTQMAAMVLAVAGSVLIAGGVVVATRGGPALVRLITSVVTLAATGITLVVVGPAVAATNVPRPEIGETPSAVGLAYEDASLRTADHVTLAAWYVPSSNRAAVILLHGAGSTRSNVLDEAVVLARAGFGVLMVDARGHGRSGGRAMDFGWHGDADIAAATAYLAHRPDVDPDRIGVVGLSMGGEEAIGASGSNALIRAVVAEGATARSAVDEAWLSDVYGLRGVFQEQLERVQDWVTDPLTSASRPPSLRSAVESSQNTRYLLITAGTIADESHAAAYIAGGAPDRVETWSVDGGGHTAGLQTAPDEWTERVITFLDDSLSTGSR